MVIVAAWLIGAGVLGLGLGATLAVARFPGRNALGALLMLAALLPPGGVGLWVHAGMSGWLPAVAAVGAATLAGLVRRAMAPAWASHGPGLQMAGVSPLRALPHVMWMTSPGVALAVLGGIGRMAAELGGVVLAKGGDAGLALGLLAMGVTATGAALAARS